MKNAIRRFSRIIVSPIAVPLLLALVALLAYGPFYNQLGFYWDELVMLWIGTQLGPDGLAHYFATNRPFWGMIYQVTVPLIGPFPWRWQLFAIFWRWLAAVLVWGILRQTWRRNPSLALWGGLFFLVYPGFIEQFISLMYSHFFIVLCAFLGSLYLNLLALRQPHRAPWLHAGALVLSFANLLTMEYFFFLEFIRPVLLWVALGDEIPEWRARFKRTLRVYWPYLFLIFGIAIWRAFFFQFQNTNYQYVLLDEIRSAPLAGSWHLLQSVVGSLWVTLVTTWSRPFIQPFLGQGGNRLMVLFAGVVLLTAASLLWFLSQQRWESVPGPERSASRSAILVGLWAALVGGVPFYLVKLFPKLDYNGDRFSLPFMLGACLVLAGLIGLLPGRSLWKWLVLSLIVSLSAGYQVTVANTYRRDWAFQQAFFWQMTWRMPGLEPGTTLLVNDLPLTYFSDNTLTAPLNWIYAPDNHTQHMDYMLYFVSVRLGRGLAALQPGLPIEQDYLAASFSGTTSQAVAIQYDPPGCLRVLEPDIDPGNRLLPEMMRDAAGISQTAPIQSAGAVLPLSLYGDGPTHGWCYYFEKADLARQQGDWQKVVKLGEQAFSTGDYPNDPLERFVFIEGYAHSGNWKRAAQLSKESYRISPEYLGAPLCALWQRIAENTPDTPDKQVTLKDVQGQFSCSS